MNKITPLKLRAMGPEVANLQEALQLFLNRDVIRTANEAIRKKLSADLKIDRGNQRYEKGTENLVTLFQEQRHLNGDGGVDKPTADAMNKLLEDLGAFHESDPDPDEQYLVRGSVRMDSGSRNGSFSHFAGVGGLRVKIVDKSVGKDVELAEALVDDDGGFEVAFTDAKLRERGKERPDLQARVFAGDKFLAASDVRYNVSTPETLNVLLDKSKIADLRSEHDTLTGALSGHFKGKLRDLKETDDQRDITYLANKTGWDARAVAMAALADQFSERAEGKIDSTFFYALFRAGLSANEDTLYQVDAATLEAVWKKAVEQGVIQKDRTGQIPAMVERFRTISTKKLLTGPALAGVSSLKEMLATSTLVAAEHEKFAELYATYRTDTPTFWKKIEEAFGKDKASRLQVDGKLGFLTINNAPLMQKLHKKAGDHGIIENPLRLAQQGYHRADRWTELLTDEVPVPKEIPGDNLKAKRANYAGYLAAQVRLSYPTASVAEIVKSEKLAVDHSDKEHPVDHSDKVYDFLTKYQGKFEIGAQPVERYLKRNEIVDAPEAVIQQVKRLQRVYQITSSDEAMAGLLKRGIDAAYHVVRYQKETFVRSFAKDLDGLEQAALVYDRSEQVHNVVLNIAAAYLTASNAPGIGVHSLAKIVQPAPTPPENAADVIAYSTLEKLFDEMDYCACDHCRSILSPAAYLVDLLLFLDREDWAEFVAGWKKDHGGAPYPFADKDVWVAAGKPPDEEFTPLQVLLSRRPDIQHLPLTCENTNTALPYIDVVNETLEYFIANEAKKGSLKDYVGHDTGSAASEDLLASPQSFGDKVHDDAYTILRDENFPAPLPFHQPLENLRRYFDKFEVPLPLAMERLRKNHLLERNGNPYGWRDILMEEIGLSRAEHEILTNSDTVSVWRMYGFPAAIADPEIVAALSNAKEFTRRVGITYEDIVDILKTRFVNPNINLIPKLERLGVPFAALKALNDAHGKEGDAAFDALLPEGAGRPDPKKYGGDIKEWVKKNYTHIMELITLVDTSAKQDPCSFDTLEFRYAMPPKDHKDKSTRIGTVEFARLLRFIRLWKKLGWTIEQTDAAICALYRTGMTSLGADHVDTLVKLDAGFRSLLPRVGVIVRVMKALNLTPKRDLLPLLACFASIDTHDGQEWFVDKDQSRRLQAIPSLYRQLFLNPAMLGQDSVFADDGYGNFMDGSAKVKDHAEALRSAFNLTDDEYGRIVTALASDATLPFNANTPLTVRNVSRIFRRGWLARQLKLSVGELLLLMNLTGLDPFAAPDIAVQPAEPAPAVPPEPPILRLIALVQALRDRSLKTEAALYLIGNQDLSGKSAPEAAQITELARTMRGDFASIDQQFAAAGEPNGDVTPLRMALVYGQEATDIFFKLLDDKLILDVAYTQGELLLKDTITALDANIAYDHFRHRLSHTGILNVGMRDALKEVLNVTDDFKIAVEALYNHGEQTKGLFFTRYPELKKPYDDASAVIPADRHSAFLAVFQPELLRKRKRQQALQRLSTAAAIDLEFTQAVLDAAAKPYPLHADGTQDKPALDDVIALETPGLSADFYFRDTATDPINLPVPAAANLDYAAGSDNPLPNPGNAISGIWRGQLETPEAGYYNFVIESDNDASVKLEIDKQDRPLTKNGNVRRNSGAIELKAGSLYDIVVTVEKVKETLRIEWETPQRTREVIPSRYLYPTKILTPFSDAYIRLLKAASLALGLGLTSRETAHFATHPDYQIAGDGWLNALAVSGDPPNPAALLKPFQALLDYARIKADLSPDDERLLEILKDPAAATASPEGLLYTLTRWDAGSLTALLNQFGGNIAGLSGLELLVRVFDAFALIQKMGISAGALLNATTNDPVGNAVRDVQAALRARYDIASWRDVIKPINDEMRGLQRDALVAYVFHQMRSNKDTAHIDTADKLFEYFLMDVEMEPCMQTSRIRHALSSVQLFIERCLMNLEPRVSPAAINAKQWEWRKRYRVWEANRKVFFYPENWLEPELRDDKSPFFKEIESELLQSDVNEESVTAALLNYLAKLEEVAKLEPCGIYHDEGDADTGEVDHVIARTAGANRKYYYRRREGGPWTPWEQVKLDIEDNPVMPVVWKGRFLLFWLRILKQAPLDTLPPPPTGTMTNVNVLVQAVLCWSEYYNGKWQPTKTSDVNRPATLDLCPQTGSSAFDRSTVQLYAWDAADALLITIGRVAGFKLYNTHSLPLDTGVPGGPRPEGPMKDVFLSGHPGRSLSISAQDDTSSLSDSVLTISYDYSWQPGDSADFTQDVLKPEAGAGRVVDSLHDLENPWKAPFFYEDSRHVFYVTSEKGALVPLGDDLPYGVPPKSGSMKGVDIPFFLTTTLTERVLKPGNKGIPDLRASGFIDPVPMQRFITEDAYIRRGIATTASVKYGDSQIGPSGKLSDVIPTK